MREMQLDLSKFVGKRQQSTWRTGLPAVGRNSVGQTPGFISQYAILDTDDNFIGWQGCAYLTQGRWDSLAML
jgi:hypothetical protein